MNTSDDQLHHPRITRAYAKSLIVVEKITVESELSVVVIIVKLKNNQRVVGDAIVANPNTFDPDRGIHIAREKIIDKIIQLEMYLLRTKLAETN